MELLVKMIKINTGRSPFCWSTLS